MWNQQRPILVLEDNPDDVLFLKNAFKKAGIDNPLKIVPNGVEALAYLKGEGVYADRNLHPFPAVIITDLKMPFCNGFEVLEFLQNHTECRVIPCVVLTSSAHDADVKKAYQLGANCYLQKPNSPAELVTMVRTLFDFWNICQIPKVGGTHCGE